jgi:hypothetical protein
VRGAQVECILVLDRKGMRREDFQVGLEFGCGGRRWLCTDVASRVIVAICIDLPHEVATSMPDAQGGRQEALSLTDHPSWLGGPLFDVVEHVFDERAMACCVALRCSEG